MTTDQDHKTDPSIVIVWDPEVIGPEKYAKLVSLLGDLARAEGAAGVERIFKKTVVIKPKGD